MTTRPTIDELSEADLAALQLALDLTLADDPPDPGRVDQITDMLSDGDHEWKEVAEFCSYHQQMERLGLHPAQQPPCWIIDADEADAILAKGPQLAYDGSGVDISDCGAAKLTKQMLAKGISVYHPDPARALRDAKKPKRQSR